MIKKCAESRILLYLQNQIDQISYSIQFITVSWITAEDMRDLDERQRILELMAKSICRTSSSFTMVPTLPAHLLLVLKRRHTGPASMELHYRRELLSWRDSSFISGSKPSHLSNTILRNVLGRVFRALYCWLMQQEHERIFSLWQIPSPKRALRNQFFVPKLRQW